MAWNKGQGGNPKGRPTTGNPNERPLVRRTRQLTPRQARFVEEYIITGNASEAYRRAYPGSDTWTPNALKVQASNALHKPNVAAAVAAKRQAIAAKVELTEAIVVAGLLKEAKLYDVGSSHSARVSAWGLLAKKLGLLVDKSENKNLNANLNVDAELEEFSLDELHALLIAIKAKSPTP